MADPTDEEIAQLVQSGDVESFGLLMGRYQEKMQRYARKFLFQGEDLHDLVQEVFIKAYVNIQSFDSRRRFSPWLYRIAHNEFVNALKIKKRERISFLDLDTLFPHPVAKDSTDRAAQDHDLRRTLDQYLGQLPPKYREPIVLFYYEEMSYQEIADTLQIPIATVGVRLSRAKAILKKFLSPLDQPYG